ncbi:Chloride channel protein [Wickerhamomyces ciferrii]|uniref:Chloride channel protein n=1 Tax=Wickerhamomyces ciferrii (strain ATCC 14091 / BCRC 22168 / CBS 111 / JCM 3599 / NBRC 0793 / NRRL Y-1031 F-60-10) TaxID=1206466 RepID=K0KCN9_WICCF|nr:Chloride channel protein [Wickerhamomyces ciferrii]CCH40661.1 Chloride channel protein [Wickerhamomyces ciferrii]
MSNSIRLETFNDQPKSWKDQIPKLSKFEDFKTIDWLNDNLQSNKRKVLLSNTNKTSFKWLNLYRSLQTYVILTAVGITIGFVAASLNIVTEYLSNIRTGYCSSHFYLNKSFCCWGELEESKCSNWVEYSQFAPLNYTMFILISLVLSFTASSLVLNYAPFAAGSGISEIKCIVSGFTLSGFLSTWTFLMKSIGLPLAIASGLSVGKEGPSVHYAVCVGSIISKLFLQGFPNKQKDNTTGKSRTSSSLTFKNILVASSAAGVAVAFGSPMGGVLFSIEEISNMFKLSTMWESYYCSLVAVFVLKLMNPFRTGQVVMFEVTYDRDWHFFEIPFFIILGVFGGIYGIIISKYNIKMVSFRKKFLGEHALKEVLILAGITSIISYFNDFLKMDMTEGMQILYEECSDIFENHKICHLANNYQIFNTLLTLALATLIRMILIVFTYGCKVPAGIFVPSMACGATFGRALGILVQLWHKHNSSSKLFTTGCLADDTKCITPGTYAFLGAASALSGITHLTVTVVVIMFELTGALKYIIPTMITVAVTKIINDNYGKGGIADQMIEFNGLPFIDPHEDHDFFDHVVDDAMTLKTVSLLEKGLTYKQISVFIADTNFQTLPIIESLQKPIIKGIIGRDELITVIQKNQLLKNIELDTPCHFSSTDSDSMDVINFTNYINPAPITVKLGTPLETVLDLFHKLGPKCILIEQDGLLKGVITRKDILRYEYYLHNVVSGHNEDSEVLKFTNDELIWEYLQNFENGLKEKFYKVWGKVSSRGRYTQLERDE